MGSSRVEDILQAGLDGTELPTAVSRVEILLKEWIEQGGNIDDILVAGSNITLTKNADDTITIDASGEVSSEEASCLLLSQMHLPLVLHLLMLHR